MRRYGQNCWCAVFACFLLGTNGTWSSSGQCCAQPPAPPPNVVLFLADDVGWTDWQYDPVLNPTGSAVYETPNLLQLAQESVIFRNAYAACPVCSPTRSSIITGQSPAQTRLTNFVPGNPNTSAQLREPLNWPRSIPNSQVTLADSLKAAGYSTGFFGKWHMGLGSGDPGSDPLQYGFDVNVGGNSLGGPDAAGGYFAGSDGMWGGLPGLDTPNQYPVDKYLSDAIDEQIGAFIEQHAGTPFFVEDSSFLAHISLQAPADLVAKYQNKINALQSQGVDLKGHTNATYAAMIEKLDQSAGKLLARLNDPNGDGDTSDSIRDQTIIIYTSDNGGDYDADGNPTRNLPLREGKGSMYEGGIRVPQMVSWTGNPSFVQGTLTDARTSSYDLYPTILDLSGLADNSAIPKGTNLDGVSIRTALEGGMFDRGLLYWHYPHRSNQDLTSAQINGGAFVSAVSDGDWKLIFFYEDRHYELYNLATDPGETTNLVSDQLLIAHNLSQALESYLLNVNAQMPVSLATGLPVDAPPVLPTAYTWTGVGGQAFDQALSWNPSGVPGLDDAIQFGTGATNAVTLPDSGVTTVNSIELLPGADPVTFGATATDTPLTTSSLTLGASSTLTLNNTHLTVTDGVEIPSSSQINININATLDTGAAGVVPPADNSLPAGQANLHISGGTLRANSLTALGANLIDFNTGTIEVTGAGGFTYGGLGNVLFSNDSLDNVESLEVTHGPLTVASILTMHSGSSLTAHGLAGDAGSLHWSTSGVRLHLTGSNGLAMGGEEVLSSTDSIVVGPGSALDVDHTLTVLPVTGNPSAVTLQEDGGLIRAHDIIVDGGYLASAVAGGLEIAPNGTIEVRNGGKLQVSGFVVDGGRSVNVGDGTSAAEFESVTALSLGGMDGAGTVTVKSGATLVLTTFGATVDNGGVLDLESGSAYSLPSGGVIMVNSGGTIRLDASVRWRAGNTLQVSGGTFQSPDGVGIGDGSAGIAMADFSGGATGTFGSLLQLGSGDSAGQVSLSDSAALTAGAVDIGRGTTFGPGDASDDNRLVVSSGAQLTPLPATSAMPVNVGNSNPAVSGNELRVLTNGLVDTGTAPTTIFANGSLVLDGGTLGTDHLALEGVFTFTSGTLALTSSAGYTVDATSGLGANPTLATGQNLEVTHTTTIPTDQTLTLDGGTLNTSGLVLDGAGQLAFQRGSLTAESITGTGSMMLAADDVNLHITGPQGMTLGEGEAVQGSSSRTVDVGANSSLVIDGTLTVRSASVENPPEGSTKIASLRTAQNGYVQADAVVVEGGWLDTSIGTSDGLRLPQGGTLTVRSDAAPNTGELNLSAAAIDGERRLAIEPGGRVTYSGAVPMTIGTLSDGGGTVSVKEDGVLVLAAGGAEIGNGGLLDLQYGSSVTVGGGENITVYSGGELKMSDANFAFPADTNLDVNGGTFNAAGGVRFPGSAGSGDTSATFQNGATGTFGGELNLNNPIPGTQDPLLTNMDLTITDGSHLTAGAVNVGHHDSSNNTLTVTGANSQLTSLATAMPVLVGDSNSSGNSLQILNDALVDTGDADTTINGSSSSVILDGGTLRTRSVIESNGIFTFAKGTLALTRSSGYTVGEESELEANPTLATGQTLEVTNTTTIPTGQTLSLDGGTLNTDELSLAGGTLNFAAGTLGITGAGGLTIGSSGLFGASFAVAAGQAVNVANTVTVDAGAMLTLSGSGQFNPGTMNNGGTVMLNGGSLTTVSGITNTSSGRMFVTNSALVAVNGPMLNTVGGRLTLQGGAAQLSGAGTLTNAGLLQGDGEFAKPVTNATGGEIRVSPGDALLFSGANGANEGRINVLGSTVEFTQSLTNAATGTIIGHGAYYFHSGLTNEGSLQFSGGNSDVHGNITLSGGVASSSKIINAAGGNIVTFYGDVVHNGSEIRTAADSSTVFFGDVSGEGSFTGAGEADFEGAYSPGNSPAIVRIDGNMRLGANSTLTMELGGTSPGTQHDQLRVGGSLFVGGTLHIALLDGFTPVSGQVFDLLDWGSLTGTFSKLSLPALAGMTWDTSQLYTVGVLSVALVGIPGDYNNSGVVDAADFVLWRKKQGTTDTLPNDPIGGTIGAAQFNTWRSHYSETAGSGLSAANAAVPEPTSMLLLFLGVLVFSARCRVAAACTH